MKRFLLMTLFCAKACISLAQLPIISSKKVFMKFKGNTEIDSLIMPVVSDRYPALKKALSEHFIFDGGSLDSVVQAYQKDGHGITGLDYTISYQNKQVISLILSYETMGAYPDSYQRSLTFNIATGKLYGLHNELTNTGLAFLLKRYKAKLRTEFKKIVKTEHPETEDIDDILQQVKVSIDELKPVDIFTNYVFTSKGILFSSQGVLPHAVRSYDVVREWSVAWSVLRRYKKPNAMVVR